MLQALGSSVLSFFATNIDDILIDVFLFSEARTKGEKRSALLGKYLGFLILVLISILGAAGISLIFRDYVYYLGILPILLGVRELFRKEESAAPHQGKGGFLFRIMTVTLANGTDNLGVYIPMFASFTFWERVLSVAVFALLLGLWCYLTMKLSSLAVIKDKIYPIRRILVPAVYILLGLSVLMG